MSPTDNTTLLEKAVLAQLALTLADRDERLRAGADAEPRRNEVVLASAGFSLREISDLTGKNYESVKTILRRSKAQSARTRGRARKASK